MINFFQKKKKKQKSPKEVLSCLGRVESGLKALSEDLEDFKRKSRNNLKKVGMIRYNPFAEVGGDQSFSVALLDEENSGVVITSHYFRDSNRVYAKPVEKGGSKYSLSAEEKKAIEKAKNGE